MLRVRLMAMLRQIGMLSAVEAYLSSEVKACRRQDGFAW